MPYIQDSQRRIDLMPREPAKNVGELNYQITMAVKAYMNEKGLTYQTINDIMGALSGASKEYYRRVAVPYENTKIATNGDVY